MIMAQMDLPPELLEMIRTRRKRVLHLTQKQAAASMKISEVWWRRIESGSASPVAEETVAAMCYALRFTPDELRAAGQNHLADLIARRMTIRQASDDLEHLVVDLSPEERAVVIAFIQTLTAARK